MISRTHSDVANPVSAAPVTPDTAKNVKIIPNKTAVQVALVAVTVGAVMMDSRFISRRMARRNES